MEKENIEGARRAVRLSVSRQVALQTMQAWAHGEATLDDVL